VWAGFRPRGSPCPRPVGGGDETGAARVHGENPQKSPDYSRISTGSTWIGLRLPGHRAACQRRPARCDALYFAPTILTDVPTDAPVMQEEIFGQFCRCWSSLRWTRRWRCLRDRPTPLALYPFHQGPRDPGTCAGRHALGRVASTTPSPTCWAKTFLWRLGRQRHGAYHGARASTVFTHRRSVCAGRSRWI